MELKSPFELEIIFEFVTTNLMVKLFNEAVYYLINV